MSKHFHLVDLRYAKPYSESGAVVTMTSLLEILLDAPLCVAIFVGYQCAHFNRDAKTRALVHCLEIVVSLFQLTGCWYFFGTEWITGMKNVPVDRNLEFTFHYTVYFWFGFCFCGMLWVFVPLYMTVRAICDILSDFDKRKID